MNKFPIPPPDRRLQKSSMEMENPLRSSNMSNLTFKAYDDTEYEKYQNMNLIKLKHIEDMRNNILSYKLLNDKSMFLNTNNVSINKCNIILFGPSGSGKSSFIKTLYRAIYGTPYLPPDAVSKLIIKGTTQNEGTLCFCRLHLKEESNESSGITICDTRGHIWMNEDELEQFKLIISGKVKDDKQIVQTKERNPLSLWEFWKKDAELFPKEVFLAKQGGLEAIPHNIVFVFDGSIDEIISEDDEKFYRELVKTSENKGKLNLIKRLYVCSCYID
jgi:energy-coupling factor transporter ATP-binding protein EcfA2